MTSFRKQKLDTDRNLAIIAGIGLTLLATVCGALGYYVLPYRETWTRLLMLLSVMATTLGIFTTWMATRLPK